MEDRLMFDRMHEALDVELPPGAYERLRTSLVKKPVRSRRRPAFPTRWSKMGFKLAAGVALIALAAATAAAIIAIHNASGNTSPAGSHISIGAYQLLIARDNPDPNKIWTDPCDGVVLTGCEADATRSIPIIQKWIDDLNRTSPPPRFAYVDAEIRQHLEQNLTALEALLADSRAGDQAAMTRDYVVAVYAPDWLGTVVPGIAASQQLTATGYRNIVALWLQHSITLCVSTCTLLESPDARSCATNGGIPCLQMFDEVASTYATFGMGLVQNAAPDSLSVKDARLQGDMAQADAVLLTMRLAVAANDQVGINSGVAELKSITVSIERDAVAITG